MTATMWRPLQDTTKLFTRSSSRPTSNSCTNVPRLTNRSIPSWHNTPRICKYHTVLFKAVIKICIALFIYHAKHESAMQVKLRPGLKVHNIRSICAQLHILSWTHANALKTIITLQLYTLDANRHLNLINLCHWVKIDISCKNMVAQNFKIVRRPITVKLS